MKKMSEFYFDYKCLAASGKNTAKGDKALDFFLYQDYKNDSMQVQVYIPPELQDGRYSSVRVYNCEFGMGFPTLGSLVHKYDKYPLNTSDSSVVKENSIFIQPKARDEGRRKKNSVTNLSSTGIIAFMREGNSEPLKEDCYSYAINYSRREVITYSVIEKKHGFFVEVKYPRLLKDIQLKIVSKNKTKPLFIGDRKNEANILKTKDNKPRIITLKKLGNNKNWARANISFEDTEHFNFRLSFADEEDNKFYMLLDNSEYTIEDKKNRLKQLKTKKKDYRSERVIKCPYCNRLLNENTIKARKGVWTCDGKNLSSQMRINYDKRKKYIICGADLVNLCSKDKKDAIAVNNLLLPEGSDKLPTMNIAVAGFPECGKTVYLASLINMSESTLSKSSNGIEENKYDPDPFVLAQITKKMARKDKEVIPVEMLNVTQNGNVERTQEDVIRGKPVDGLIIKGRYRINPGKKIERHTNQQDAKMLAWNPIGFKMGDLGFLYFYDVPGEVFKPSYKEKLRTFDVADGIIAIINGDSERKTSTGNTRNISYPLLELDEAIKAIKRLSNDGVKIDKIPIAIVFTKLDLRISTYLTNPTPDRIDDCFDENCHILRENMIELFPKNHKYHGSQLESHIDLSSYEMEQYLQSLPDSEKKIYDSIVSKYSNIKFFACSALGSDRVFDLSDNEALVKYQPRRLRIELPIVWLMHKKGLIGK